IKSKTYAEVMGHKLPHGTMDGTVPSDPQYVDYQILDPNNDEQVIAEVAGNKVYILFDLVHGTSYDSAWDGLSEIFAYILTEVSTHLLSQGYTEDRDKSRFIQSR